MNKSYRTILMEQVVNKLLELHYRKTGNINEAILLPFSEEEDDNDAGKSPEEIERENQKTIAHWTTSLPNPKVIKKVAGTRTGSGSSKEDSGQAFRDLSPPERSKYETQLQELLDDIEIYQSRLEKATEEYSSLEDKSNRLKHIRTELNSANESNFTKVLSDIIDSESFISKNLEQFSKLPSKQTLSTVQSQTFLQGKTLLLSFLDPQSNEFKDIFTNKADAKNVYDAIKKIPSGTLFTLFDEFRKGVSGYIHTELGTILKKLQSLHEVIDKAEIRLNKNETLAASTQRTLDLNAVPYFPETEKESKPRDTRIKYDIGSVTVQSIPERDFLSAVRNLLNDLENDVYESFHEVIILTADELKPHISNSRLSDTDKRMKLKEIDDFKGRTYPGISNELGNRIFGELYQYGRAQLKNAYSIENIKAKTAWTAFIVYTVYNSFRKSGKSNYEAFESFRESEPISYKKSGIDQALWGYLAADSKYPEFKGLTVDDMRKVNLELLNQAPANLPYLSEAELYAKLRNQGNAPHMYWPYYLVSHILFDPSKTSDPEEKYITDLIRKLSREGRQDYMKTGLTDKDMATVKRIFHRANISTAENIMGARLLQIVMDRE